MKHAIRTVSIASPNSVSVAAKMNTDVIWQLHQVCFWVNIWTIKYHTSTNARRKVTVDDHPARTVFGSCGTETHDTDSACDFLGLAFNIFMTNSCSKSTPNMQVENCARRDGNNAASQVNTAKKKKNLLCTTALRAQAKWKEKKKKKAALKAKQALPQQQVM